MTTYSAWRVLLDGEEQYKSTSRTEVHSYAEYLAQHPVRRDRLLFGDGGRVEIQHAQGFGPWVEVSR